MAFLDVKDRVHLELQILKILMEVQ